MHKKLKLRGKSKTRQNTENKQTFDLMRKNKKYKGEKLVKAQKIKKILI